MDRQKKFDQAESEFLEGRDQVNWVNWQRDTALNFYYGKHLYLMGYDIWMQRKPEEAYPLMKKAKSNLTNYRALMKGNVNASWQEEMDKIQKVIDFLKVTGVGK